MWYDHGRLVATTFEVEQVLWVYLFLGGGFAVLWYGMAVACQSVATVRMAGDGPAAAGQVPRQRRGGELIQATRRVA